MENHLALKLSVVSLACEAMMILGESDEFFVAVFNFHKQAQTQEETLMSSATKLHDFISRGSLSQNMLTALGCVAFIYAMFLMSVNGFWLPADTQSLPTVASCLSFLKQLFAFMATAVTAGIAFVVFGKLLVAVARIIFQKFLNFDINNFGLKPTQGKS